MFVKTFAMLAFAFATAITTCGPVRAADYRHVRVRLVPIGIHQTQVIVLAPPSLTASKLTLVSGSDCAARGVARIGLSGLVGGRSQTLVTIPIGAFRRGRFAIDLRDATNQARISETCDGI